MLTVYGFFFGEKKKQFQVTLGIVYALSHHKGSIHWNWFNQQSWIIQNNLTRDIIHEPLATSPRWLSITFQLLNH